MYYIFLVGERWFSEGNRVTFIKIKYELKTIQV